MGKSKMKLGTTERCWIDDRITIEINPSWVEAFMHVYTQKSLECKEYDLQGQYREKADYFRLKLKEWQNERKKKDGK